MKQFCSYMSILQRPLKWLRGYRSSRNIRRNDAQTTSSTETFHDMGNSNIVQKEDIFDLALSKKEGEFIEFGTRSEFDVATNLAEVLTAFPYIGSLVKLGLIAKDYFGLRFFRKIAYFLSSEQHIPEQEKEAFLASLGEKDRKMIADYIIHYLLTAEDDEKAQVLGYLYHDRVKGELDDTTFLRLCHVVNRIFLPDLKKLPNYQTETEDTDYEVNSFINLGLIDNELGGVWKNSPSCELNDLGKALYRVLHRHHWL